MLSRLLPAVSGVCLRCVQNSTSAVAPKSRYFIHGAGSSQKIVTRRISLAQNLEARSGRTFVAKKISLGQSGTASITVGQIGLAGASVFGIGALCYYGLGLSSEAGAIDRAALWPKFVRQRVQDTYLYFVGSLAATAVSATAIARNPTAMRIVSSNGLLSIVLSIGAMIGTSMICRSIDYKSGFGTKQITWLMHAAVVGAVIAPITILGGPLLVRAAWYTAGVVGGLSAIAMCAPSEQFLRMRGPLAAGLGVVFVASIGSAFFPPTGALGLSLYSISVYGGLILFSAFLLYDTQKIVKMAETHPVYSVRPFDPINASMSIYMDAINIFIRIAMILSGGNRKK